MARTNRDREEGGIGIEPYELPGGNKSHYQMAFYSILDRYKYARFVYECLFASSQSGRTCFDPLFYHYPSFVDAYIEPESTFLVGDAIKVSPVLRPLKKNETFESFFPPGRWVDMDTFAVVAVTNELGGNITLTPQLTVKKHLRPGYIVPVQYNETNGTMTWAKSTDQLAVTGVNLLINRDADGFAAGKLFLDEGRNMSEIDRAAYEYYEFRLTGKTLQKMTINSDHPAEGGPSIASIVIADAADLNTTEHACALSRSGVTTPLSDPEYDSRTQTLTLRATDGEIDIS